MSQELTWDALVNKLQSYEEELKSLRYDKFHSDAYIGQLHDWIKSDSVYILLRYGSKSPSSSGVDDCEDDHYSDLYNLSTQLRAADRSDTANRNDAFQQQLP